jgi:glc operon protein GlcG
MLRVFPDTCHEDQILPRTGRRQGHRRCAEAEALANKWAVTIAIVDDGGHLLGCSAWTAPPPSRRRSPPPRRRPRRWAGAKAGLRGDDQRRPHVLPVRAWLQGLLEGGVPILKDGQCIGAVGVSGVKSTEDAQIARAGIAALGL